MSRPEPSHSGHFGDSGMVEPRLPCRGLGGGEERRVRRPTITRRIQTPPLAPCMGARSRIHGYVPGQRLTERPEPPDLGPFTGQRLAPLCFLLLPSVTLARQGLD